MIYVLQRMCSEHVDNLDDDWQTGLRIRMTFVHDSVPTTVDVNETGVQAR